MRLQRFLARGGVESRRKCEALIESGRVKVNGRIITELGFKVDPINDVVEFDSRRVCLSSERVVIALNKPVGYLSAMQDERTDKVVSKLVPTNEYPSLFAIGRLDKDTSGLLLFTTDGELGYALMHPSKEVAKRYVALIDGKLSDDDIFRLEHGIELDGEEDGGMTAPAKCELLEDIDGSCNDRVRERHIQNRSKHEHGTCSYHMQYVLLEIHEGRNRQVRRMFKAVGHEVLELERISIGSVVLGDLKPGKYRKLEELEVSKLYAACGLK